LTWAGEEKGAAGAEQAGRRERRRGRAGGTQRAPPGDGIGGDRSVDRGQRDTCLAHDIEAIVPARRRAPPGSSRWDAAPSGEGIGGHIDGQGQGEMEN
jgi:hypothetical protein